MKRTYNVLMILLVAVMLVMPCIPASAESSCTASACTSCSTAWAKTQPSSVTLAGQMAPSSYQYKDKANLMNEINKTRSNVNAYAATTFGAQVQNVLTGAGATKSMFRYPNGTWHITITVRIPAGYRAVVTDYLFNLRPVAGSFNIAPAVNFGYYLEWHLPARPFQQTVTLTFNARQQVPGFVGDQGFVYYYYGSGAIPRAIVPSNFVVA
jgi:hypothetical protein